MAHSLTGNGPYARHLFFNSEDSNYELWEIKMISYLRLQKLHEVVVDTDDAILRSDPTEAADIEKNKKVFATLVQFLDDQALKLIIRDAKNNGRHSLQILRDHYLGSTKPRVISMYCDLTSLKAGTHGVVLCAVFATSRKMQQICCICREMRAVFAANIVGSSLQVQ